MTAAQTINGRLRQVPAWPLYFLGLIPLLWMIWQIATGDLGVDPTKTLEHEVGLWALRFIVAGLCITPLRRLTGVSLLKYRRAVGLVAFFYVCVHLLVWLGLDIQFRWGEIWGDILRRWYITLGMLAFVLLIPLAVTSNNLSIRKMGAGRWARLHWLVYPIAVLGCVHYLMAVKAYPPSPLIYLGLTLLLLLARAAWKAQRQRSRARTA